ncbi:MAG: tripartite tricarboxylate transporter TctB family protein [Actinomycetota bacterium]
MKRFSLQQVDIGIGAIVVALALFVLVQSLQLDFYLDGIPGPGFFPTLLAVALGLAGVALAVTSFIGRKESEEFEAPSRAQLMRSLSVWLAVAGSVLLVPIAGFLLSMLALAAVLILGLERKRTLAGIAAVILIPLLAYLVFSVLLGVSLPTGVFGI